MTLEEAPDFLTPTEVAELLRIGRNQAYAMFQSGELPGARQCRRAWRVPKAALLEYFGITQTSAPEGKSGALREVAASGAVDRGSS